MGSLRNEMISNTCRCIFFK